MISASELYKKEIFRNPDPFAVVTYYFFNVSVNGEQTHSTSVVKKTLNPYWNESFVLEATPESVLTIQIFDQKKWKKDRNQGFLGVVNLPLSNFLNGNGTLKVM